MLDTNGGRKFAIQRNSRLSKELILILCVCCRPLEKPIARSEVNFSDFYFLFIVTFYEKDSVSNLYHTKINFHPHTEKCFWNHLKSIN